MKFKTSLRFRVTSAFALLGMVISFSLAGVLYVLIIKMEERLIAETLSAELEDYIKRFQVDPKTSPPSSTVIKTFVIDGPNHNTPNELRTLKPGLHHFEYDNRTYYAEVRIQGRVHFIVLFDDAQIVHRENQFKAFLSIGVGLMTLLSALLGYWMSGRVIAPVRDLATRVAGLIPEDYSTPLEVNFTKDEVGLLAHEFDAYLQRLSAFIEREQAFTADASHELRTPLAVIEGATEVLLDNPNLDRTVQAQIQRIARSAHEMCELVSALLLLAREEKNDEKEYFCDIGVLLQQIIESHKYLIKRKRVEVKLDIIQNINLPVECVLLKIVLANIVRNALTYTEEGVVYICFDGKGVTVKDTGIGIPSDQIQRIFDRFHTGKRGGEGIGLSLVKRICKRYNWKINIESTEGKGTIFRLQF